VEGGNEDDEAGVFEEGDDDVGKNLGAIFDDAKEMEHPRRPPLALVRPVTAPTTPSAPGGSAAAVRRPASQGPDGGGKKRVAAAGENEDRRLAVYLRLRPPVASDGSGGGGGALDTIEVVVGRGKVGAVVSPLPTAVRTYPPPQSKAAKVVRGGTLAPQRSLSSSKSAS